MKAKTFRWRVRHDEECERIVSNLAYRCTCGARADRVALINLLVAANSAVLEMEPRSPARKTLHAATREFRLMYPKMPNLGRTTADAREGKQG